MIGRQSKKGKDRKPYTKENGKKDRQGGEIQKRWRKSTEIHRDRQRGSVCCALSVEWNRGKIDSLILNPQTHSYNFVTHSRNLLKQEQKKDLSKLNFFEALIVLFQRNILY